MGSAATGPDSLWSDTLDWNGGTVAAPGTINNTGTATFNAATGSYGTITVNPTRNIENITFTNVSSSVSAGPYVIGSTSGSTLFLTSGGTLQIGSAFNAVNTDIGTVNEPMTVEGGYTFTDAAGGAMLDIGGSITNAAAATLTIGGAGDLAIAGRSRPARARSPLSKPAPATRS